MGKIEKKNVQVMIIEDVSHARERLAQACRDKGYDVIQLNIFSEFDDDFDEDQAINDTLEVLNEKKDVRLILIDLGLPTFPDEPIVGIKLIEQIRGRFLQSFNHEFKILAYSERTNVSDWIVSRLLRWEVSYFIYRNQDDHQLLASLLPYVDEGFFFLSRRAASRIINIIQLDPDPLNKHQWEVLYAISHLEDLTLPEIEQCLGLMGKGYLATQLNAIYKILRLQKNNRNLATKWWHENNLRYYHEHTKPQGIEKCLES